MLIKRIGYFLVGVSLGSIGVYFFWQKKNATFDYGMDARTLKTIRIKERVFSDNAKRVMLNSDIDSTKISTILYTGDVDFGKSKPRQKPCAEYYITGNNELENVSLYVSRCDSVSTIKEIIID
ncbi:hypothetical protein LPB03_02415 [Polaribacter vadi]|mgnify:FL=1|uniref:DUF4258 domain-containing protein n=1 Tax=Polaribacter vadi TaxID=1774273 RepID=A0A1B8U206_9FLAO|nr:DUF4258 domain-containing protein [Polaribacter vadi]AOW16391.1 hypothetical protein LPB03_02415 [Polaribacter vadi]OBY65910.1 hypothetical protein LPB3_02665 [Polaribacter vadi]